MNRETGVAIDSGYIATNMIFHKCVCMCSSYECKKFKVMYL